MMCNKLIKLLFWVGLCFPIVGTAEETGSASKSKSVIKVI